MLFTTLYEFTTVNNTTVVQSVVTNILAYTIYYLTYLSIFYVGT